MNKNESNAENSSDRTLVDKVGSIEKTGVDYIPEEQRKSSPVNIWYLLFGGSMTFGIIVIGWIPISIGLSWKAAISAIIVGSIIGSTLLASMSLFGTRTGTNNPVSSGAHFGAMGRLIGSVLGILACLVFAALSVWAAGDVLAGTATRIFGGSGTETAFNLQLIAYALVAIVMTYVSVLGHANMVAMTKWMIPTSGLLMVVAIFLLWPNFDPGYAGGNYALGSFWPTWFLGMISVAATIQSYGPYAGDWTRHISHEKFTDRRIFIITWLGGFIGMGGAFAFGAYTAVTFANPTDSYASEFVASVPFWYLIPLLYIALVPGTAQAVINIYSMGLDFSAIVVSLSRVQATIILSIVSTIMVYFGAIYQQLEVLVSSFLGILVIMGAPWVIINVIGFINRKGYYYPMHLQVFNQRKIGGRYWFRKGLNIQATTAWAISVIVGVFFLNTGWYIGPGAKLLGEADIGLFITTLVASVLYISFLYIFPEPKDAFGPKGATFKCGKIHGHESIRKEGAPYTFVNKDGQISASESASASEEEMGFGK